MASCVTWIAFVIALGVAGQTATAMPRSASSRPPPRPHKGSGGGKGIGHRELHFRDHRYSSTYDPDYYRDECMSQTLTCVPVEDCVAKTPGGYPEGRVCPINFTPHDSLCVLNAFKKRVEPRTQAQVVDYCRKLRARPYYFQSSKEWTHFYNYVERHAGDYYDLFMLDARWEKDHDRWEWLSSGEEIEWEKLLRQANCSKENRDLVRKEDGCLAFSLDRKSQCLRLRKIKCTETALPFFCKDGSYDSRCGQSEDSMCCATPTYSFYSKNTYGAPGSTSIHKPSKRDCWVKLTYPDTQPVTCHKALDILGTLHPFPQPVRVGRSFYYFSHNPCRYSRQAVVSGMEVHDFIMGFLLTEELQVEDRKYIIGLQYKPDDDEFLWENGKPIDYYNNETFWAEGEPDKQSGTNEYSCVAYMRSGKNSYAWHLLPNDHCTGPSTVNVCEMPIRSTNLVPTAKKVPCGQRLERGVLARSFYNVGYDDEEAQYGEFPWHVAVLQPSTYKDGVVLTFSCSGVLIHPGYVLTSAHCVIYSGNGDFSVSLGEWDLNDDEGQILETKLVAVNDVIIHPDFKSTSIMHDVALLQLERKLDVDSYPHIGLGCLPFPRVFYQATDAWECYTVGWPSTRKGHDKNKRILQRIESDFLGGGHCRRYTGAYYDKAREHRRDGKGYDKEYGAHHLAFEHHGYFENQIVDLICTEPYDSDSCLDDDTPILVCRKASFYSGDPFGNDPFGAGGSHYGQSDRHDFFGHGDSYGHDSYGHGDKYGQGDKYGHGDYGPGDKYHVPGDKYSSGGPYGHDKYGAEDKYHGPGDKYHGPGDKYGPEDKYHGPGDKYHGPGDKYGPDKYYSPGDKYGPPDKYGHGDKYDHDKYGPGDKLHHPDKPYGPGDKHYGPADKPYGPSSTKPHGINEYGPGDKYGPSNTKPHGIKRDYGPGDDHYGPPDSYKHQGRSNRGPYPSPLHLFNSRIINSFGDDRFDSDKWYVMGIGHTLNSCDPYGKEAQHRPSPHNPQPHRRPHQVFTPVHEYLSFIHHHLEPQQTSTVDDFDVPNTIDY